MNAFTSLMQASLRGTSLVNSVCVRPARQTDEAIHPFGPTFTSRQSFLFTLCIIFCATPCAGQTTVTTSGGTAGYVPVFTGTYTVASSAISQASGNIGIGTTSPASLFSVGPQSQFRADGYGNITQQTPNSATSSSNWGSPVHSFQGSFWNGTASVADTWSVYSSYAGGNYPGPLLNFTHSGAAGYSPTVLFSTPVTILTGITNTSPPSQGGLYSLLSYTPNSNSNYAFNATATANAVNSSVSGTGINTYGANVITNHWNDFGGTGGLQSVNVQSNTFQIQGGTTSYGNVAVDKAYASLSSTTSNIGTLALFSGQLALNSGPTIGTLYGLYLPPITGATNNYAVYAAGGQSYFGGNLGVGTASPASLFSVGSSSQFQVNTSGTITTSGGLTVSAGTVSMPSASVANSALQGGGAMTVSAGAGLSGGGTVV